MTDQSDMMQDIADASVPATNLPAPSHKGRGAMKKKAKAAGVHPTTSKATNNNAVAAAAGTTGGGVTTANQEAAGAASGSFLAPPSASPHVQFAASPSPSPSPAAPAAAGTTGGTAAAAAAVGSNVHKSGSRKKKPRDEVTFDATDLSQPLPVNLKVFCKSQMTGRYHSAKVLETRKKDDKFKIQSVPWPPCKNPPLPVVDGVQPDFSHHTHIYYIHYLEWDRRMDEWVYRDRLCLPHQLPLLQPPMYNLAVQEATEAAVAAQQAAAENAAKEKKGGSSSNEEKTGEGDEGEGDMMDEGEEGEKGHSKSLKKGKSKELSGDGKSLDGTTSKSGKGKGKGDGNAKMSASAVAKAGKAGKAGAIDPAAAIPPAGGDPHGGSLAHHGNFSEEDIKAHEEATKVKNIESIVVGKYHMSTWYYSPFPPEYNQYNVLHFCEFCLNFFGYEEELKRHSRKCQLRHPPGNEIYRSQEKNVLVSVWEVDGAREKVYCQNLCLLAKLFLDHKTLEFDCTPFLFYIFCEVDEHGHHMVGYFSKEKISVSKFNLACILALPCHQRKGYGKLIISLSYELSKIEEKVGSPEKPISDLGKVSYMSYWSNTLLKILSTREWGSDSISIEDLSRLTCITTDDIIECLKHLHILIWYKGKWVFSDTALQSCLKEREEKRVEASKKEEDPNAIFVAQCRPELLHWNPFFVTRRMARQAGAQ